MVAASQRREESRSSSCGVPLTKRGGFRGESHLEQREFAVWPQIPTGML
jgi:hypothetical protein